MHSAVRWSGTSLQVACVGQWINDLMTRRAAFVKIMESIAEAAERSRHRLSIPGETWWYETKINQTSMQAMSFDSTDGYSMIRPVNIQGVETRKCLGTNDLNNIGVIYYRWV
jgi:hypothetical protein